jgi:nucleoside-diphosphate-sugar epimerase
MPGRERVLITGGNGFIGSQLARQLIADGYDVHLVLRRGSDLGRLADVAGGYTPHWADLRDAPAVGRAVAACRPEVIYHLAMYGAYPAQRDRGTVLATNVLGTANLLDALAGHDFRVLVHTGTAVEYGVKGGPIREDDRLEPCTDYGVAKAAATLLCRSEALRGRPVTTVRLFSTYGPGEPPGRLVPTVMACCLRGEPPRITGASRLRDFIYIDDVIDLLKLVADSPAAFGQILHAGTGRACPVRDMVAAILAAWDGAPVRAEFDEAEPRPGDPAVLLADMRCTARLTGWQARYGPREGVARTWAWARSAAVLSRRW